MQLIWRTWPLVKCGLTWLTLMDSPQTLVYRRNSHFRRYCGGIYRRKRFIRYQKCTRSRAKMLERPALVLNSTQPEITDAGVNTCHIRINISNVFKSNQLITTHSWSVSGTSQFGCKIKLNYLVRPEVIQPCFKCINSAIINYVCSTSVTTYGDADVQQLRVIITVRNCGLRLGLGLALNINIGLGPRLTAIFRWTCAHPHFIRGWWTFVLTAAASKYRIGCIGSM